MYAHLRRAGFLLTGLASALRTFISSWRRIRPSAFFALFTETFALSLYDSLSHTQITYDRRRRIMNSSRFACYLYKNKFIILIPFAPQSVRRVTVLGMFRDGNLHSKLRSESTSSRGNLRCGSSRTTIETDDRSYIAPSTTLC